MFCTKCGKEIPDEAVVCIGCGCLTEQTNSKIAPFSKPEKKQISVIFGIVGIVFAWLFAIVGHITSVTGIIIGIKEYKETNKMTGLALSIIGEACSIFSSIIGAVIGATTMSGIF